MARPADKFFADYFTDAADWITTLARPFYPDYLEEALLLYRPIFNRFGELLEQADSSAALLRKMMGEPRETRIQLLRVFRKYISPITPVEMLKTGRKTDSVISGFGDKFRPIDEVRAAFQTRPPSDEALAAVFWEHHDRGTPGYEITEIFFDWFEATFPLQFTIIGPRRAGADIALSTVLTRFDDELPADFVIAPIDDPDMPSIIGFAHYDSDRGGAQEDDRTGGYRAKVELIMQYAARRRVPLKVLFVNDGPGLLLGSMWRDYASLEQSNIVDDELRVLVSTLKMLDERVTENWLNL